MLPSFVASLSTACTSNFSPYQQQKILSDDREVQFTKEEEERLKSCGDDDDDDNVFVEGCTGEKQESLDPVSRPIEEPLMPTPLHYGDFFTVEEREKQRARYIHGKIVHADGSSACVPAGESPNELPRNFLNFYNGNEQRAMKAWKEHQQWRKERNLWKMHTKPDPCFDTIKQAYPHFCHGRSKKGWVVMYEFPGRMDMDRMFHSDVKPEDILHHDIFILEYCANVLHDHHNASNWGMMGVMDLRDVKSSEFLSREVFHYLTMISQVNDAHYPLHVKKVFMINAPFWLAGAFKMIKPVLPPSINIEILSSDYMSALREYCDDCQLPKELGGSSPYKLGLHPMELDLIKLARSGTDNNGCTNDATTIKVGIEIEHKTNDKPKAQLPTESGNVKLDHFEEEDASILPSSVNTTSTIACVQATTITAEAPCLPRHWPLPLKLPSLCSTSFTANSSSSSSEDEEENDDEEEKDHDDNLVSYDRSFLIGKGPLRPRIPSFEPVLSADEEKHVIATFYSSEHSLMNRQNKHNGLDEGVDDDKQETVPCGEIVWTTLLGGCG